MPQIGSHGQPDHHAARRACAWCFRATTIMAWRAPRRASRWPKARSRKSRRRWRPEADGGKPEADPLLEPPLMPLQLPKANAKRVDGKASQDLTAHPWAGLKVRMTLVARDVAAHDLDLLFFFRLRRLDVLSRRRHQGRDWERAGASRAHAPPG